ncbi:MAG: TRAM domain-containing protein [Candidatus Diapherotrites archaeon]|nr:TRAM domain-containing protein [Candidatus Diapherotrites archaeon]
MNGRFPRNSFPADKPVKEGQEYDVEIESVGEKGDGIAKIKGFVIIVPGAKKGDKIKVKINAIRKSVAFSEIVGKSEAKAEESESSEDEDSEKEDSEEESEEEPSEDSEESEDEEEESEESPEDEEKFE